jgi:hypothetical protein
MDFLLAALVRWWRRRANFENFSFFESGVRLTRAGGERSCTCGQKWYRTSTNCPNFLGCGLVEMHSLPTGIHALASTRFTVLSEGLECSLSYQE